MSLPPTRSPKDSYVCHSRNLGVAYVSDVTLSDDTLSLELVGQKETGTSENLKTHLLDTTALYASAPFVRPA
jgi:hypothetical protein